MVERKLHSGQFTDYDGNTIEVEIFRKIDFNATPTSFNFGVVGASSTLSIWSRDGDAELYDSQVDWLSWSQIKSERLPGSDYYKYTYRITVTANNTGSQRSTNLGVGLETGQVVGWMMNIPVTQNG